MKNKKYFKMLIILFIFVVLSVGICSEIFAQDLGLGDKEAYKANQGTSDVFIDKIEVFLGLISIVGTGLSVVILIIIGIKYMLGSVEERAEYKQELRPYLIGCFILFTGSTVPQIIYDIMQGI